MLAEPKSALFAADRVGNGDWEEGQGGGGSEEGVEGARGHGRVAGKGFGLKGGGGGVVFEVVGGGEEMEVGEGFVKSGVYEMVMERGEEVRREGGNRGEKSLLVERATSFAQKFANACLLHTPSGSGLVDGGDGGGDGGVGKGVGEKKGVFGIVARMIDVGGRGGEEVGVEVVKNGMEVVEEVKRGGIGLELGGGGEKMSLCQVLVALCEKRGDVGGKSLEFLCKLVEGKSSIGPPAALLHAILLHFSPTILPHLVSPTSLSPPTLLSLPFSSPQPPSTPTPLPFSAPFSLLHATTFLPLHPSPLFHSPHTSSLHPLPSSKLPPIPVSPASQHVFMWRGKGWVWEEGGGGKGRVVEVTESGIGGREVEVCVEEGEAVLRVLGENGVEDGRLVLVMVRQEGVVVKWCDENGTVVDERKALGTCAQVLGKVVWEYGGKEKVKRGALIAPPTITTTTTTTTTTTSSSSPSPSPTSTLSSSSSLPLVPSSSSSSSSSPTIVQFLTPDGSGGDGEGESDEREEKGKEGEQSVADVEQEVASVLQSAIEKKERRKRRRKKEQVRKEEGEVMEGGEGGGGEEKRSEKKSGSGGGGGGGSVSGGGGGYVSKGGRCEVVDSLGWILVGTRIVTILPPPLLPLLLPHLPYTLPPTTTSSLPQYALAMMLEFEDEEGGRGEGGEGGGGGEEEEGQQQLCALLQGNESGSGGGMDIWRWFLNGGRKRGKGKGKGKGLGKKGGGRGKKGGKGKGGGGEEEEEEDEGVELGRVTSTDDEAVSMLRAASSMSTSSTTSHLAPAVPHRTSSVSSTVPLDSSGGIVGEDESLDLIFEAAGLSQLQQRIAQDEVPRLRRALQVLVDVCGKGSWSFVRESETGGSWAGYGEEPSGRLDGFMKERSFSVSVRFGPERFHLVFATCSTNPHTLASTYDAFVPEGTSQSTSSPSSPIDLYFIFLPEISPYSAPPSHHHYHAILARRRLPPSARERATQVWLNHDLPIPPWSPLASSSSSSSSSSHSPSASPLLRDDSEGGGGEGDGEVKEEGKGEEGGEEEEEEEEEDEEEKKRREDALKELQALSMAKGKDGKRGEGKGQKKGGVVDGGGGGGGKKVHDASIPPSTPASLRPLPILSLPVPIEALMVPRGVTVVEKEDGGGELWWLWGRKGGKRKEGRRHVEEIEEVGNVVRKLEDEGFPPPQYSIKTTTTTTTAATAAAASSSAYAPSSSYSSSAWGERQSGGYEGRGGPAARWWSGGGGGGGEDIEPRRREERDGVRVVEVEEEEEDGEGGGGGEERLVDGGFLWGVEELMPLSGDDDEMDEEGKEDDEVDDEEEEEEEEEEDGEDGDVMEVGGRELELRGGRIEMDGGRVRKKKGAGDRGKRKGDSGDEGRMHPSSTKQSQPQFFLTKIPNSLHLLNPSNIPISRNVLAVRCREWRSVRSVREEERIDESGDGASSSSSSSLVIAQALLLRCVERMKEAEKSGVFGDVDEVLSAILHISLATTHLPTPPSPLQTPFLPFLKTLAMLTPTLSRMRKKGVEIGEIETKAREALLEVLVSAVEKKEDFQLISDVIIASSPLLLPTTSHLRSLLALTLNPHSPPDPLPPQLVALTTTLGLHLLHSFTSSIRTTPNSPQFKHFGPSLLHEICLKDLYLIALALHHLKHHPKSDASFSPNPCTDLVTLALVAATKPSVLSSIKYRPLIESSTSSDFSPSSTSTIPWQLKGEMEAEKVLVEMIRIVLGAAGTSTSSLPTTIPHSSTTPPKPSPPLTRSSPLTGGSRGVERRKEEEEGESGVEQAVKVLKELKDGIVGRTLPAALSLLCEMQEALCNATLQPQSPTSTPLSPSESAAVRASLLPIPMRTLRFAVTRILQPITLLTKVIKEQEGEGGKEGREVLEWSVRLEEIATATVASATRVATGWRPVPSPSTSLSPKHAEEVWGEWGASVLLAGGTAKTPILSLNPKLWEVSDKVEGGGGVGVGETGWKSGRRLSQTSYSPSSAYFLAQLASPRYDLRNSSTPPLPAHAWLDKLRNEFRPRWKGEARSPAFFDLECISVAAVLYHTRGVELGMALARGEKRLEAVGVSEEDAKARLKPLWEKVWTGVVRGAAVLETMAVRKIEDEAREVAQAVLKERALCANARYTRQEAGKLKKIARVISLAQRAAGLRMKKLEKKEVVETSKDEKSDGDVKKDGDKGGGKKKEPVAKLRRTRSELKEGYEEDQDALQLVTRVMDEASADATNSGTIEPLAEGLRALAESLHGPPIQVLGEARAQAAKKWGDLKAMISKLSTIEADAAFRAWGSGEVVPLPTVAIEDVAQQVSTTAPSSTPSTPGATQRLLSESKPAPTHGTSQRQALYQLAAARVRCFAAEALRSAPPSSPHTPSIYPTYFPLGDEEGIDHSALLRDATRRAIALASVILAREDVARGVAIGDEESGEGGGGEGDGGAEEEEKEEDEEDEGEEEVEGSVVDDEGSGGVGMKEEENGEVVVVVSGGSGVEHESAEHMWDTMEYVSKLESAVGRPIEMARTLLSLEPCVPSAAVRSAFTPSAPPLTTARPPSPDASQPPVPPNMRLPSFDAGISVGFRSGLGREWLASGTEAASPMLRGASAPHHPSSSSSSTTTSTAFLTPLLRPQAPPSATPSTTLPSSTSSSTSSSSSQLSHPGLSISPSPEACVQAVLSHCVRFLSGSGVSLPVLNSSPKSTLCAAESTPSCDSLDHVDDAWSRACLADGASFPATLTKSAAVRARKDMLRWLAARRIRAAARAEALSAGADLLHAAVSEEARRCLAEALIWPAHSEHLVDARGRFLDGLHGCGLELARRVHQKAGDVVWVLGALAAANPSTEDSSKILRSISAPDEQDVLPELDLGPSSTSPPSSSTTSTTTTLIASTPTLPTRSALISPLTVSPALRVTCLSALSASYLPVDAPLLQTARLDSIVRTLVRSPEEELKKTAGGLLEMLAWTSFSWCGTLGDTSAAVYSARRKGVSPGQTVAAAAALHESSLLTTASLLEATVEAALRRENIPSGKEPRIGVDGEEKDVVECLESRAATVHRLCTLLTLQRDCGAGQRALSSDSAMRASILLLRASDTTLEPLAKGDPRPALPLAADGIRAVARFASAVWNLAATTPARRERFTTHLKTLLPTSPNPFTSLTQFLLRRAGTAAIGARHTSPRSSPTTPSDTSSPPTIDPSSPPRTGSEKGRGSVHSPGVCVPASPSDSIVGMASKKDGEMMVTPSPSTRREESWRDPESRESIVRDRSGGSLRRGSGKRGLPRSDTDASSLQMTASRSFTTTSSSTSPFQRATDDATESLQNLLGSRASSHPGGRTTGESPPSLEARAWSLLVFLPAGSDPKEFARILLGISTPILARLFGTERTAQRTGVSLAHRLADLARSASRQPRGALRSELRREVIRSDMERVAQDAGGWAGEAAMIRALATSFASQAKCAPLVRNHTYAAVAAVARQLCSLGIVVAIATDKEALVAAPEAVRQPTKLSSTSLSTAQIIRKTIFRAIARTVREWNAEEEGESGGEGRVASKLPPPKAHCVRFAHLQPNSNDADAKGNLLATESFEAALLVRQLMALPASAGPIRDAARQTLGTTLATLRSPSTASVADMEAAAGVLVVIGAAGSGPSLVGVKTDRGTIVADEAGQESVLLALDEYVQQGKAPEDTLVWEPRSRVARFERTPAPPPPIVVDSCLPSTSTTPFSALLDTIAAFLGSSVEQSSSPMARRPERMGPLQTALHNVLVAWCVRYVWRLAAAGGDIAEATLQHKDLVNATRSIASSSTSPPSDSSLAALAPVAGASLYFSAAKEVEEHGSHWGEEHEGSERTDSSPLGKKGESVKDEDEEGKEDDDDDVEGLGENEEDEDEDRKSGEEGESSGELGIGIDVVDESILRSASFTAQNQTPLPLPPLPSRLDPMSLAGVTMRDPAGLRAVVVGIGSSADAATEAASPTRTEEALATSLLAPVRALLVGDRDLSWIPPLYYFEVTIRGRPHDVERSRIGICEPRSTPAILTEPLPGVPPPQCLSWGPRSFFYDSGASAIKRVPVEGEDESSHPSAGGDGGDGEGDGEGAGAGVGGSGDEEDEGTVDCDSPFPPAEALEALKKRAVVAFEQCSGVSPVDRKRTTLGCGVDIRTGRVLFTQDGVFLGFSAVHAIDPDTLFNPSRDTSIDSWPTLYNLRPAAEVFGQNTQVRFNFGAEPFLYSRLRLVQRIGLADEKEQIPVTALAEARAIRERYEAALAARGVVDSESWSKKAKEVAEQDAAPAKPSVRSICNFCPCWLERGRAAQLVSLTGMSLQAAMVALRACDNQIDTAVNRCFEDESFRERCERRAGDGIVDENCEGQGHVTILGSGAPEYICAAHTHMGAEIPTFPGITGDVVLADPASANEPLRNSSACRDAIVLVSIGVGVAPAIAAARVADAGAAAVAFLSADDDPSELNTTGDDRSSGAVRAASAAAARINIPVIVLNRTGAATARQGAERSPPARMRIAVSINAPIGPSDTSTSSSTASGDGSGGGGGGGAAGGGGGSDGGAKKEVQVVGQLPGSVMSCVGDEAAAADGMEEDVGPWASGSVTWPPSGGFVPDLPSWSHELLGLKPFPLYVHGVVESIDPKTKMHLRGPGAALVTEEAAHGWLLALSIRVRSKPSSIRDQLTGALKAFGSTEATHFEVQHWHEQLAGGMDGAAVALPDPPPPALSSASMRSRAYALTSAPPFVLRTPLSRGVYVRLNPAAPALLSYASRGKIVLPEPHEKGDIGYSRVRQEVAAALKFSLSEQAHQRAEQAMRSLEEQKRVKDTKRYRWKPKPGDAVMAPGELKGIVTRSLQRSSTSIRVQTLRGPEVGVDPSKIRPFISLLESGLRRSEGPGSSPWMLEPPPGLRYPAWPEQYNSLLGRVGVVESVDTFTSFSSLDSNSTTARFSYRACVRFFDAPSGSVCRVWLPVVALTKASSITSLPLDAKGRATPSFRFLRRALRGVRADAAATSRRILALADVSRARSLSTLPHHSPPPTLRPGPVFLRVASMCFGAEAARSHETAQVLPPGLRGMVGKFLGGRPSVLHARASASTSLWAAPTSAVNYARLASAAAADAISQKTTPSSTSPHSPPPRSFSSGSSASTSSGASTPNTLRAASGGEVRERVDGGALRKRLRFVLEDMLPGAIEDDPTLVERLTADALSQGSLVEAQVQSGGDDTSKHSVHLSNTSAVAAVVCFERPPQLRPGQDPPSISGTLSVFSGRSDKLLRSIDISNASRVAALPTARSTLSERIPWQPIWVPASSLSISISTPSETPCKVKATVYFMTWQFWAALWAASNIVDRASLALLHSSRLQTLNESETPPITSSSITQAQSHLQRACTSLLSFAVSSSLPTPVAAIAARAFLRATTIARRLSISLTLPPSSTTELFNRAKTQIGAIRGTLVDAEDADGAFEGDTVAPPLPASPCATQSSALSRLLHQPRSWPRVDRETLAFVEAAAACETLSTPPPSATTSSPTTLEAGSPFDAVASPSTTTSSSPSSPITSVALLDTTLTSLPSTSSLSVDAPQLIVRGWRFSGLFSTGAIFSALPDWLTESLPTPEPDGVGESKTIGKGDGDDGDGDGDGGGGGDGGVDSDLDPLDASITSLRSPHVPSSTFFGRDESDISSIGGAPVGTPRPRQDSLASAPSHGDVVPDDDGGGGCGGGGGGGGGGDGGGGDGGGGDSEDDPIPGFVMEVLGIDVRTATAEQQMLICNTLDIDPGYFIRQAESSSASPASAAASSSAAASASSSGSGSGEGGSGKDGDDGGGRTEKEEAPSSTSSPSTAFSTPSSSSSPAKHPSQPPLPPLPAQSKEEEEALEALAVEEARAWTLGDDAALIAWVEKVAKDGWILCRQHVMALQALRTSSFSSPPPSTASPMSAFSTPTSHSDPKPPNGPLVLRGIDAWRLPLRMGWDVGDEPVGHGGGSALSDLNVALEAVKHGEELFVADARLRGRERETVFRRWAFLRFWMALVERALPWIDLVAPMEDSMDLNELRRAKQIVGAAVGSRAAAVLAATRSCGRGVVMESVYSFTSTLGSRKPFTTIHHSNTDPRTLSIAGRLAHGSVIQKFAPLREWVHSTMLAATGAADDGDLPSTKALRSAAVAAGSSSSAQSHSSLSSSSSSSKVEEKEKWWKLAHRWYAKSGVSGGEDGVDGGMAQMLGTSLTEQVCRGVGDTDAWRLRPKRTVAGGWIAFKHEWEGEHAEGHTGPFREALTEICMELMGDLTSGVTEGNDASDTIPAHESLIATSTLKPSLSGPPSHAVEESSAVGSKASELPLLATCPNGREGIGENRRRRVVRMAAQGRQVAPLWRALGRLLGIALRCSVQLPLNVTALVWELLHGNRGSKQEIKAIASFLATTLANLRSSALPTTASSSPDDADSITPTTWVSTFALDGTFVEMPRFPEASLSTTPIPTPHTPLSPTTPAAAAAAAAAGVAAVVGTAPSSATTSTTTPLSSVWLLGCALPQLRGVPAPQAGEEEINAECAVDEEVSGGVGGGGEGSGAMRSWSFRSRRDEDELDFKWGLEEEDAEGEEELSAEEKVIYAAALEALAVHHAESAAAWLREGIFEIISPAVALQTASGRITEFGITGPATVNIEALRDATEVTGGGESGKQVARWFFDEVAALPEEQRALIVRFWSALSRLPGTKQGYVAAALRPQIIIQRSDSSSSADSTLPRADTCFFKLTLPHYSSRLTLRERLQKLLELVSGTMTMDGDNVRDL